MLSIYTFFFLLLLFSSLTDTPEHRHCCICIGSVRTTNRYVLPCFVDIFFLLTLLMFERLFSNSM